MLTDLRMARSTAVALCRLAGPVPLGAELRRGPWLVAELGLLCAVVALVVAVAPASPVRRRKRPAGQGESRPG
ncbi:hypothetical protein ACFZB9_04000 [Kitasatospora sp. NPDC008050]|uniref:hypothetical protein n=1 Tax=Kitasatospora sp. NPDC008050 TaxID=3364021 RepID=UPI0036E41A6F